MRIRMLVVLAMVTGAFALPATLARAQTDVQCALGLPVEDYLSEARTVFIGKVVDRSNLDRTATMQVLEVWKGRRLEPEVVVNGGPEQPNQQTAIDRTFLLGQIYLVFPATERAPFRDSLCTGTQLWSTPTGSIPAHLQAAVGGDTPIQVFPAGGGIVIPDASGPAGAGEGIDPLVVAMGVTLAVLMIVFFGKRFGPFAERRRARELVESGEDPSLAGLRKPRRRRRRRRLGRFAMPEFVERRRTSRLAQVKRGSGRFRKAPGEHEREQLQRAVKRTATHAPKRKNLYTSGRRSAP